MKPYVRLAEQNDAHQTKTKARITKDKENRNGKPAGRDIAHDGETIDPLDKLRLALQAARGLYQMQMYRFQIKRALMGSRSQIEF
mgnify:CR=1 FL=1